MQSGLKRNLILDKQAPQVSCLVGCYPYRTQPDCVVQAVINMSIAHAPQEIVALPHFPLMGELDFKAVTAKTEQAFLTLGMVNIGFQIEL